MNKQTKRFVPFLIALYLVLSVLPIALSSEPLQGGISTSVELPAVPTELRVGAMFNEANLPPPGRTEGWQRIPFWSAGTFHRETQTELTSAGPVTTLSRTSNEPQRGEQIDRQGGVWGRFSLPSISTIEQDQVTEWQVITDEQPLQINEEQIVKRFRFMAIDVSKRNGKIVKVFQKEEFDTIRPRDQGTVIKDAWLTLYNEKGKRLYSMRVQALYYLTRPFEPIAIDPKTGLDLRQDFKNYLLSHGLANLVPVDN